MNRLGMIFAAIFVLFGGSLLAEPARGWLTGEEGDFLQYECSEASNGILQCDFTQVTMYLKRKPEEVEGLIAERLPSVIEQFEEEDIEEVCQYILPLHGVMDALARGDEASARAFHDQMPITKRREFDIAEALDQVKRLDPREVRDMRATMNLFKKICDDPEQGDVESLMRLELEKEKTEDALVSFSRVGIGQGLSSA